MCPQNYGYWYLPQRKCFMNTLLSVKLFYSRKIIYKHTHVTIKILLFCCSTVITLTGWSFRKDKKFGVIIQLQDAFQRLWFFLWDTLYNYQYCPIAILLISVLFSFKFFLNREPGMCEKLTKIYNLNKGISVEDHIP